MNYYKFIGQDGSMGFTNGTTYPLQFWVADFQGLPHLYAYWVNSKDIPAIPYASLRSFLQNWELA